MKLAGKKKSIVLFLALFAAFCSPLFSQNVASRITNSPYPVSSKPDTLCLVNYSNFTTAQQLTTVTLQGVLAVTKPRIMVQAGNLNLQTNLTNYGVVFDSTYYNDFNGLVAHFANKINGYLLCKVNTESANVAITACRSFNAIAVTPADTALMSTLGIPQIYNMIGKTQQWAFDTLQPVLSKKVVSYQDTTKCTLLSDYSIMAGAFHYWDTAFTFHEFSDTIYNNLSANSVMMGWGPDEHKSVLQCSQHGVMVNASDFSSNLSVYSNMSAAIAQHNISSDTDLIPGTHTVCFVFTDGDNIQWLGGDFGKSSRWYGSPKRGIKNIGWTMSPALAELAPTSLQYFYDSAASNPGAQDYFIASASGMGYYYPDTFKNLDSAAEMTARMMAKADLHILNIIGDNFTDSLFEPYLKQPNIDAIFYYDYNSYAALAGKSICVHGKPVISARGNMWTSPWLTPIISEFVNAFPKDPTILQGYSLIDVNVWSDNVDSILSCISQFGPNIRVVTPDAFVKLFSKGVSCASLTGITEATNQNIQLEVFPNPSNGESKVLLTLPTEVTGDVMLYDVFGRSVKRVSSGLQTEGQHQWPLNTSDLSAGIYLLNFKSNGFTVCRKLIIAK